MVQILYKTWLLISKIIGVWTTSDKQWKVQKVHIFRLAIACIEIRQIPQVIFGTKSQLFNFLRMFYRIVVHKV